MVKRNRSIEKKLRFTKQENHYINQKVKSSPFGSFQSFALNTLIQGTIHYTDYSELNKLNSEVRKIGTNINQIAKLAHQFDEISLADIKELTDSLTVLIERVDEELATGKKEASS